MKSFSFLASLSIAAFALLLSSCDVITRNNNRVYYLDNPTANTIVIKIDEKDYALEPQTYVSLKLASGLHKLTYDAKSISFTTSDKAQGGILNVTGSYYVIELIAYVVNEKDRDNYRESKTMNNDFFIQPSIGGWTFFLYEPPKSVIRTSNKNMVGSLQSKIFSEQEFLTASGDPHFFEEMPQMSLDKYKRSFITIPDFEDKELAKSAKTLEPLFDAFISEQDGEKMIEKRTQIINISSAMSINSYNMSTNDRKAFSVFLNEISALTSKSVRIQ